MYTIVYFYFKYHFFKYLGMLYNVTNLFMAACYTGFSCYVIIGDENIRYYFLNVLICSFVETYFRTFSSFVYLLTTSIMMFLLPTLLFM